MKTCLFCKETIQDTAIKCRFCGEFLNQQENKGVLSDFDLACINEIHNGLKNESLSNRELLKLRGNAHRYATYDSKMSLHGRKIMRELRDSLNTTMKEKISGLIEADKDHYDKLVNMDDAISKALESGGYNDLNELLPEINEEKNKKIREIITKIMPDIPARIEAINMLPTLHKALEKTKFRLGWIAILLGGVSGYILGLLLGGYIIIYILIGITFGFLTKVYYIPSLAKRIMDKIITPK